MNREKQLFKNTIILAIGNLSTKCMTFILVPLYTKFLSTSDYGLVDLLNVFIMLLVPIVSAQLTSGLFRFMVEAKDENRKSAIMTNIEIVLCAFCFIFLLLCYFIGEIISIKYWNLLTIGVVTNIFSEMELQYARGEGKFRIYSVASFIIALVTVLSNLIMIILLDMGGKSILLSAIISYICGGVFVVFFTRNYQLFNIKLFNVSLVKDLLKYSIPLIPNQLSWWITNASDRIIVTIFLGTSANGLLGVAHKLPSIYTTVFNIFNVTWAESICRAIDDDDATTYINGIFQLAFRFLSELTVLIIAFIPLIFDWYIGNNFAASYNLILILCIAVFFNSIGSLYGGIFLATKQSVAIAISTVVGAIINIITHLALIKVIGLYAAVVSTLISYIVIVIIRGKQCIKWVRFKGMMSHIIILSIFSILTIIAYISKIYIINWIVFVIDLVWFLFSNKEILMKVINKKITHRK